MGEDKRALNHDLLRRPRAAEGILGKSYFRRVEAQSSLRGVVKRREGKEGGQLCYISKKEEKEGTKD